MSAAAPDLADERYDRVLYVHMAALATVDGRDFTADTLLADTLDHEEHFWAQGLGAKSLSNLGASQAELGHREAALDSAVEALDAIWPFFLAVPVAFARNAEVILRGALQRHQDLGRAVPPVLVERVRTYQAKLGQ